MSNLKKKNILMIAPTFFGYRNKIAEEIGNMGGEVKIVNAYPDKYFYMLLNAFKYFKLPSEWLIRRFEDKQYKQAAKSKYDHVLVICGTYITSYLVKKIKENLLNDEGRMTLYYWDSISLLKDDQKRVTLFDSVYTFDYNDYVANKEKMNFLPLFYCNEYRQKSEKEKHNYNLATIGSYKYDRYFMIRSLKEKNPHVKVLSYLYTQQSVFMIHKLLRKKYREIRTVDLSFKKLTSDEIRRIYSDVDAILDIPRTGQNGLTMRTFECLAMKKKLVTTNDSVKYYDFYNPQNIYVMDEKTLDLPSKDWFNNPYVEYKEGLIENYSISSWIGKVLS